MFSFFNLYLWRIRKQETLDNTLFGKWLLIMLRKCTRSLQKCLGLRKKVFATNYNEQIASAQRWDVKGKRYFSTILKYYAMDLGLRNARLNWRQQERSHLMENMLYNDLVRRGYSVDVGVVELEREVDGKRQQSQYEIDFVVNTSMGKVYIQSALNVDTPEKKAQETFSLRNTGDFCRKIVVLDGSCKLWTDEDGVMYVGVIPFLLDNVIDAALTTS